MDSQLLRTPGRGISRFSKALPQPPPVLPADTEKPQLPVLKATSLHSPLPPLPKEKMSTMAIPRRPVGGGPTVVKSSHHKSVSSVSSMYSDNPGFTHSLSNSSQRIKDSVGAAAAESNSTPPLPPKDNHEEKTPQTPKANPILTLNYSPPRPELWRRRSQKSSNGVAFPELNLTKSNGSTACPPQIQKEQPAILAHLPRSQGARKPIPVRDAPPQPDLMGSKLSKLKNNDKPAEEHTSGQKRLPTPEYLKTDVQQPAPKVLSPVSPETPPNESENVASSDTTQRGFAVSDNQRPAVQIPPGRSDFPLRIESSRGVALSDNQRPAGRSPSGGSDFPTRTDSDTLTITSEALVASPQPKKAFAARILTPQPSPSPIQTPTTLLPSPRSNYNGLPRFPILPSPRAPPGTIMPAPQLDIMHLDCYQSHKHMRSSRYVFTFYGGLGRALWLIHCVALRTHFAQLLAWFAINRTLIKGGDAPGAV